MVHFIYKSYKDVSLSGDSVMPVLYVGMWAENFEKRHSLSIDLTQNDSIAFTISNFTWARKISWLGIVDDELKINLSHF